MTENTKKERIPLGDYTVKTIGGTCYKVCSIYVGEKDFKQLFEDLVVAKAAQREHCGEGENAV